MFAIIVFVSSRKHRKSRHYINGINDLRGYYFIKDRQVPHWINAKGWDAAVQDGVVEEVIGYAKGKHFEYKYVVIKGNNPAFPISN